LSEQIKKQDSGGISGKGSSLWGQIIAALWIGGWSAFKFIARPDNIDIGDVLISGVGIAGVFIPVYFSILMDKIKEIRLGKNEEGQGK
jgi:hypothetical protein